MNTPRPAPDSANKPRPPDFPVPETEADALNTSVTEDERTHGGPKDESGDPKLDTSTDI